MKIKKHKVQPIVFEQFAEVATLGFGMASLDGTTQYVNPAMCRILEIEPEEIIGKSFISYYPSDMQQKLQKEVVPTLMPKGFWQGELIISSKNGKLINTSESYSVIYGENNKPLYIIDVLMDITELKRLQQENLQKSEEKFTNFVQHMPLPLCNVNNATGDILYYNDKFHEKFGYTLTDIPNLKNWWEKAYPDPEYRQEVMKNWNEAVERAAKTNTEITPDAYSVTCKDGTEKIIIIGGVTIGDEFLATFQDITERIKSEKMLIDHQKRLNSMFDGIEDVIYVADPDTYELLYFNKAARDIWGEDYQGKKCYEVLQNRDAPCPFCTNKQIMKEPGKSVVWEFQNEVNEHWYRCFDKAIYWTSDKYVRFELALDITEIKNAQALLAKEKSITESVLDSIPGIFYQIDTKGQFVRTNKNFQKLVGKTEEKMLELSAVELFEGEQQQIIANAMQKVFVKGSSEVEASMITINGKIPYYFTGILQEIDGQPYLLGVGSDITQIKETETILRKTNKELETFNKMAVGREKRMIDLKSKINILSKELGNEEPYDLSFVNVDEV